MEGAWSLLTGQAEAGSEAPLPGWQGSISHQPQVLRPAPPTTWRPLPGCPHAGLGLVPQPPTEAHRVTVLLVMRHRWVEGLGWKGGREKDLPSCSHWCRAARGCDMAQDWKRTRVRKGPLGHCPNAGAHAKACAHQAVARAPCGASKGQWQFRAYLGGLSGVRTGWGACVLSTCVNRVVGVQVQCTVSCVPGVVHVCVLRVPSSQPPHSPVGTLVPKPTPGTCLPGLAETPRAPPQPCLQPAARAYVHPGAWHWWALRWGEGPRNCCCLRPVHLALAELLQPIWLQPFLPPLHAHPPQAQLRALSPQGGPCSGRCPAPGTQPAPGLPMLPRLGPGQRNHPEPEGTLCPGRLEDLLRLAPVVPPWSPPDC